MGHQGLSELDLQLTLPALPNPAVRHLVAEADRRFEMRNGFLVGRTGDGLSARLFPTVDSRLRQTGCLGMLGQDLRRCIPSLLQDFEKPSVKSLTSRLQQALIGG